MRIVGILTGLTVLGCVVPASASAWSINATYDQNGDPYLVAPSGAQWRVCPSDGSACTPLTTGTGSFALAESGPEPAGTVFEAAYQNDTQRTPPWGGRLTPTSVPTLAAVPLIGQQVPAITPATWTGGWGDAFGQSDITSRRYFVCSRPDGGECWGIDPPTSLDARWAGWYLGETESRYRDVNTGYVTLQGQIPPPYRIPAPTTGTSGLTATSAFYGPMQLAPVTPPPVTPPRVSTPAAPKVTLRARALRSHGRLNVGRVDCPARCTVTLTVGKLKRTLHVTGLRSLTVPVRHGRLKVRVVVDGKPLASRTTLAR
jgi:hypothetical protein